MMIAAKFENAKPYSPKYFIKKKFSGIESVTKATLVKKSKRQ
jgi:hypothetical protein